MTKSKLPDLKEKFILPLISSAAVLRKEKFLKELFAIASGRKINPQKIYECLLQIYLFAGFPTALISLKIFSEYFNVKPYKENFNVVKFTARGIKNCKIIYADKYDKLISNVYSFSPQLSQWLIVEGYGKTIGRKGLELKERELCIVSVLTALKFEDQLISHIKGAVNTGNSKSDIKKCIKNLQYIRCKTSSDWGIKIFESLKF